MKEVRDAIDAIDAEKGVAMSQMTRKMTTAESTLMVPSAVCNGVAMSQVTRKMID